MTQLHTINRGIGVVRPTNDVDIVLHIETTRGLPQESATALRSIGHVLRESVDPRHNTAHRFIRGTDVVDLVTSKPSDKDVDVVDVLIADHPAPSIKGRLLGREMVSIDGGTQALQRTVNANLEIEPGTVTTISVPRPFGALILKVAAYRADSREPGRHLEDAVALLACVEEPMVERKGFAGSDRGRLAVLKNALLDDHIAWQSLPEPHRSDARAALRLLCMPG